MIKLNTRQIQLLKDAERISASGEGRVVWTMDFKTCNCSKKVDKASSIQTDPHQEFPI